MHLTTQEVAVQDLKPGMYVSRLDVPWVQTPFPLQGFHITTQEELELLSHYCNKVYVDVFLSKVDVTAEALAQITPGETASKIDPKTLKLMNEKARFKPRVENYDNNTNLKKEVKAASKIYEQISAQIATTYQNMEKNGLLNVSEIRSASTEMVKSVINNPNALAWLSRISSANEALHQQAVRSSIWALIFARHLGLSKQDLCDLGTALLLAPIGKCKLPADLLLERKTPEEAEIYQSHIQLTIEETEKIFSLSHQVNYILYTYCERHNGSGYPRQLVGNRIPFLGRVAGIAVYYEQLINPYSGKDAYTPVDATSHLYSERGNLFQKELVEEFIQAVGIYPTGSMVQLNNNSVGVIIEQPEKSRLRPRVAILKDANNVTLPKAKIVNLAKEPTDENGVPLKIEKSLKSTSNDISAQELHDKIFGSRWLSFFKKSKNK